jgi:two-component system, cell cycle response regulator
VLIVEDDDDLRRLFRLALTLAHFNVSEARGGLEALRQLDIDPPDLVVLDLVMPHVDGFTVRRELELHPHTRHIPVVVVTAIPAQDVYLAANCWLTKPVSPDELVAAVKGVLGAESAAGA